ncbi:MAG: RNA 2',3'-cyclic phosphodiesterase [Ramlibacter sp.]
MGTMPAQPLRLFTGLWPDAATAAEIARWQAGWQWPSQAAPTQPERLHVTLHFLGNVAGTRVAELVDGLRVPVDAFTLEFGAGEVWPNGVAVLLPSEQPAALSRLHARLGDAVRRLQLPVEERPYRPHVTLARRARGASPPPAGADLRWRVADGYVLACSLPGGAGYEILHRFG